MDRRELILQTIVKHFIQTAEPVGSNTIVVSYNFSVSPATIRNDMAILEKEGLIEQPHTSAGRIPTASGYRRYVDKLANYEKAKSEAKTTFKKVLKNYQVQKTREKIYDAVSLLAQSTNNVSFATLPDNSRTFYLGLANALRQPEFAHNSIQASQVVEVLEKNDNFVHTLNELDVGEDIKIYIGEENLFEQIKSCSLVVTKYSIKDFQGYIGLLGPTRMKYPFNVAILEEVKKFL